MRVRNKSRVIYNFFAKKIGRHKVGKIIDDYLETRSTNIVILVVKISNITEITGDGSLVEVINQFYNTVISVVTKYSGSVDLLDNGKVVSVFGYPWHEENFLDKSYQALNNLETIFHNPTRLDNSKLKISIGVAYGKSIIGEFGNKIRANYGAIGATPYYANLLCDVGKNMETCVNKEFFETIPLKKTEKYFLTKCEDFEFYIKHETAKTSV